MLDVSGWLSRATLVLAALAASPGAFGATTIIGSKAFTESVILGELAGQLTREAGYEAQHKRELGGTRVLWSALVRGGSQCYPEYAGTLRTEIFAGQDIDSDAELRDALARESVWTSEPLGFNNTYVRGMR